MQDELDRLNAQITAQKEKKKKRHSSGNNNHQNSSGDGEGSRHHKRRSTSSKPHRKNTPLDGIEVPPRDRSQSESGGGSMPQQRSTPATIEVLPVQQAQPLDPIPDHFTRPSSTSSSPPVEASQDLAVPSGMAEPTGRKDRRAIRAAQMASSGKSVHEQRQSQRDLLDRLGQDVKDQLSAQKFYRPYFTYISALAQVCVMVCALFRPLGGNTARFDFKAHTEVELGVPIFDGTVDVQTQRPINMWYGPDDLGVLNFGAMFTPCMRNQDEESRIREEIATNEEQFGCCIHANGRCGMMNSSDCAFTFNAVSCVDLPQCAQATVLHPCCSGRQGQCNLTTLELCDLLPNHIYHPDKVLCSEVNCLEEMCGMKGFYSKSPDQWYRLFTAIFMHAGIIHLCFNILFQIKVVAELEEFCGPWRVIVMYFLSGIGGNIIGSIFNPNSLSTGSSGALYGMMGVLVVDMFNTWQMLQNRWLQLVKLMLLLVIMLGIGTLKFIDNWAHCGGFFTGVLCGIAFLPYINFGKWDKRRKFILQIVAIVAICAGSVISVYVFYQEVDPNFCSWCRYVNCIPYTKGFCDDNTL